uniref:Uncharacterized protein n=1 Tax=Helicotheca tamesis TaxID=374047 RepID=A0A6U0GYL9_9STRA|mmetsp:Transcript_3454/g.4686  ORF Transcript_3454/g.4686 Transcript_3454/m.4686 type:complete len:109 (+) Transcript_3454:255-581(+)|eukprot:CAMPEP_0185726122 /NCGR_PEP_ID=MMETSP1171-20130828/2189_1 /TAXON_ID=374046 /ORGANISM="Helicotheca tamensis, Strain CCMP826" /LENGTH=108 /DNA_ID=CAMNT_0028394405 /DNA_START=248 /DNA_END=574 /DNA_ORIENTATION=+
MAGNMESMLLGDSSSSDDNSDDGAEVIEEVSGGVLSAAAASVPVVAPPAPAPAAAERFLMFTRVLMKYLEQKDKPMHARARAMIKECYDRNKKGDPAYASLTMSMQTM